MTSDRKVTLHKLYLTYVQRYAADRGMSVKSVIEGLIDEHIVPALIENTDKTDSREDLQEAASRLLPSDWRIESIFAEDVTCQETTSSKTTSSIYKIILGEAGTVYSSSHSLHTFGQNLQTVIASGGSATLENSVEGCGTSIYATRRGNGLVFRPVNAADDKNFETFSSRHIDKLITAFALMVRSQFSKLKGHEADVS